MEGGFGEEIKKEKNSIFHVFPFPLTFSYFFLKFSIFLYFEENGGQPPLHMAIISINLYLVITSI